MTALAVMAALVAALFVALQSVSAANCALNPGLTLGFNQNCDIDVAKLNDKATNLAEVIPDGDSAILSIAATTSTDDAATNINIVAQTTTGTRTVNITAPDDTNTPADTDTDPDVLGSFEVTVVGFAISKVQVVGDTDGLVSAGDPVTVRATIRSASADAQVRLTVPTTGLSISTGTADAPATSQVQEQDVPDSDATTPLGVVNFTVNTAGAPAGTYTLTFTADNDGDFTDAAGTAEADKRDSETLELTIGEPGTGLASATLSLGNSKADLPFTDANESVAETGSDVAKATSDADGKINLVIEAFDSDGVKANSGAINQILVIAPKGTITSSHATGAGTDAATAETAGGDSSATLDEKDAETGGNTAGDVTARTVVSVSKTDEKPGTVTVYAIVSGPGGAAQTGELILTFTGSAASLMIADAAESLLSVNPVDDPETDKDEAAEDMIKLLVTAEDSAGNSAPPPTSGVSIVIEDPDGKRQGSSVIAYTQPTPDKGKFYITLTGKGTAASPLKAGNWTLTAKSGKLEATAMFAVAGAPARVSLGVDNDSPSGDDKFVIATATVSDKSDGTGNRVADGTEVTFSASGEGKILSNIAANGKTTTKNGVARATFVVVGPGRSIVTAVAGNARDAAVVVSTAGAPAPVAQEPEPTATSISVSLSEASGIGSTVTATAAVEGDDGVQVTFSSSNANVATLSASDGSHSATFVVTGYGIAVISASGGGQVGSATLVVSEPAAEDAPSAPSLSDFGNGGRTGITSYSGPDATASELLALLAGRATAIWLSTGDGWVLYASVDGAMVPGSENFTATSGDVVYISN